jgi:hypothetical protein
MKLTALNVKILTQATVRNSSQGYAIIFSPGIQCHILWCTELTCGLKLISY